MHLTSHQTDRAIGAILGSAAGDALGSQYEFGPAHDDSFTPVQGVGTFGHAVGEWTDDTSMALSILRVLAGDLDPSAPSDIDPGTLPFPPLDDTGAHLAIVREWIEWSRTAKDVGNQTRAVLDSTAHLLHIGDLEVEDLSDVSNLRMLPGRAAREHHERTGRSAGNGALMRTGPVGLAGIAAAARTGRPRTDRDLVARAAGGIARLTHWEEDNTHACVLWSLAIEHAILTGELDVARGLDHVPAGEPRDRWARIIDAALADGAHPRDFAARNGWVVAAFQAALAAVAGADDYREAMYRAVRGGNDTDTVAAIAGALAGALWGQTQIPGTWLRRLHGWPGTDANGLVRLAALAVRNGEPDGQGWPSAPRTLTPGLEVTAPVRHPLDDGVWLGSQGALDLLPARVGAVVSLSRVGTAEVPDGLESVRVRLIDSEGHNLNLERTLTDVVDVIAEIRAEGTEVFVHCAEARSRTAAVAALYGARHRGATLEDAWDAARRALPRFEPERFLREAVGRLAACADRPGSTA